MFIEFLLILLTVSAQSPCRRFRSVWGWDGFNRFALFPDARDGFPEHSVAVLKDELGDALVEPFRPSLVFGVRRGFVGRLGRGVACRNLFL
jgi:hypothetical protein